MKSHDDPSQVEVLIEKLRWLRLPGMAVSVKELLERAAKDNLTPVAIIDRLCDAEKHSRIRSSVARSVGSHVIPPPPPQANS